jgi:hypothetical protein
MPPNVGRHPATFVTYSSGNSLLKRLEMAITIDFAPCAKCGEKNSKSAQRCRVCSADLPWSQAAKDAGKLASNPLLNSPVKGPSMEMPSVSQGFIVQCVGGLIFLCGIGLFVAVMLGAAPWIPMLRPALTISGAAIWRAGSNMEN